MNRISIEATWGFRPPAVTFLGLTLMTQKMQLTAIPINVT